MATPTPSKEEEATREWAELPRDALLSVLHKLDQVDALMGAGQVCRPWRAAARDEPELWRSVEVRPSQNVEVTTSRALLCGLARAAVRRAAGQCEAFSGEGAVDDSVLSLLADAAPSLKRLRIIYGVDDLVVDERFRLTITKFSLLEELELAVFTGAYPETCEAVGAACPLLKRLRLNRIHFFKWRTHDSRHRPGGHVHRRHHARPALAPALRQPAQRPRPHGHPRRLRAPRVPRHPPVLQRRHGRRRDTGEVSWDPDAEAPRGLDGRLPSPVLSAEVRTAGGTTRHRLARAVLLRLVWWWARSLTYSSNFYCESTTVGTTKSIAGDSLFALDSVNLPYMLSC